MREAFDNQAIFKRLEPKYGKFLLPFCMLMEPIFSTIPVSPEKNSKPKSPFPDILDQKLYYLVLAVASERKNVSASTSIGVTLRF